MGTADPLDSLLEARQELDLILALQRRRQVIALQENQSCDWVDDKLRERVIVMRTFEPATDVKPEVCDYDFGSCQDFVLDCSRCEWEPEENAVYYVRLTIHDSDDELLCKWSVKQFSAAISPKLWLLTVEFCEE